MRSRTLSSANAKAAGLHSSRLRQRPGSGAGPNHGDTGCHADCWRTSFRSSRSRTDIAGARSSMNPFAVLGLEETADDEAVRAAYVQALRTSPPDRDPE